MSVGPKSKISDNSTYYFLDFERPIQCIDFLQQHFFCEEEESNWDLRRGKCKKSSKVFISARKNRIKNLGQFEFLKKSIFQFLV